MESHLRVVPPEPNPEASPLGAARVRRRLTVEEVAARTGLPVEDIRSLEEGRIYRFPSVSDAISATLVVATALGMTEREARGIAGVEGGGRWRLTRVLPALAFVVLAALLVWFVALPQLRDAEKQAGAVAASAEQQLPPPWEVRVDVFNGTEVPNAATLLANEIGGPLAYRLGTVENAERLDYVETRVYYPEGSDELARRLADELGVSIQALPGGGEENRLVVIVGADRATAG
jgi:transcriptional regulator with XRE-family HTH domain